MVRVFKSRQFEKQFAKLPVSVQEAYFERMKLFVAHRQHPLLHDHALTREWIGHRSINVTGNYRAVYWEITDDSLEFVAIGTHPQLYRM